MKVRDAIKLVDADEWRTATLKQAGVEEMKYAVLYAPTATGYSAHVPDLPGCIGAAATLEETRLLMKEAIRRTPRMHA